MGGVDKGLQLLKGRALVEHVIERLRPQVGPLLINANRHAPVYAAFGFEVVSDGDDHFNGPLAGLQAGLRRATTDWLLSVPCDAPLLPLDLAARLAQAATSPVDVVFAVSRQDGRSQVQPTFCLLRCQLRASLADHLAAGGRQLEGWLRAQRHMALPFDQPGDAEAFYNANTLTELQHLEHLHVC